jgi:hypothetical protein
MAGMDRIGGWVSSRLPIHDRPRVDAEHVGRVLLSQPELNPALPYVLAERLRNFGIVLWFPTFKPNADQWQKGNAAMASNRRDELEPKLRSLARRYATAT